MPIQRTKRSIASLPFAISAIGVLFASGCLQDDSATGDGDAIAMVVASLGEFAVSFARNLSAAWLL